MSYNKVIILGRLGADPESRFSQSGMQIVNLNLATNDRRRGPDGEYVEKTEWHRIVVFGRQAESCAKYLRKGRQVLIEGRIQTRSWEDSNGNKRWTTEILANAVTFVGSRGDSAPVDNRSASTGGGGGFGGGQGGGNPGGGQGGGNPGGGGQGVPDFSDDDIPF